MFQGCLKHVLKKLQGYFKRALKVLERKFQSFKSAPRKVQGCFREVSTICQKCFKELRGCFKEVLFSNFVVAWYSLQLPEQKEGLFCIKEQRCRSDTKTFFLIKVTAKTKNVSFFLAFFICISSGLREPLRYSKMSQIFFGSSPVDTE